MDVLTRIMELLERSGHSQKELMDYLGIKKSAFTDWKAGKSQSYVKYASQIADYFGVTTDYILRGSNNHNEKPISAQTDELPEIIQKIVDDATTLPPEKQLLVLELIKSIKQEK